MCTRILACLLVGAFAQSGRAEDKEQPTAPSDPEITRLLVGKWEGHDPLTGTKGTIHYAKDGTFVGDGTVTLADGEKVMFQVEGSWKVMKGTLHFTITKSTRPGIAPVGVEVKEVVHGINEKTVRYTRGLGSVKERKRIKE
jgi:hypothetical protein